jgi:uncharacterized protein (TIRG00374 family)
MNETQSNSGRVNWKLLVTLATFIALAILVYSLRKQIVDVIGNLRKVNTIALLFMIPLEAANYDVYARLYRRFLAILGEKVRYWPMFRLTLELNFVNHILPSGGVSGISYFNVRMRKEDVSTAKATLTQVMRLFLLYLSFQPLLILGVFLLALRGHTNNLIILVTSSLVTLLVVGTLIGIYVLESRRRAQTTLTAIAKVFNRLIQIVRPKHPETISLERAKRAVDELHDNYLLLKQKWRELKMPFIYMLLANITEVATLYMVYIAFGELVNVGAVILAYAVANFAGLISVLPAGIGVFEGLMTAVLVATGIPAEVSIPVTIMYRVINMFIQLTPGYFFYQRAVRSGLGAKT